MDNTPDHSKAHQTRLKQAATAWFVVAMTGQLAFIGFIVAYYGIRTINQDFSGWNDKPLIDGYIAGDWLGNFMFIAHALLAAVVTFGGLVQLIPCIRTRALSFHRWNGRVFVLVSVFLAVNGLWLVWVRGTMMSVVSAISITVNGVLILLFGFLAWRFAWKRQIAAHRRFALRMFVVVNGVWFLRIGMMSWMIINQGPRGMNETMSGPADLLITFGSYLIPLAILELYFLAQRKDRPLNFRLAMIGLSAGTLVTAIGVFGTTTMMWWPFL